jgi:elongator complex protein 2
VCQPVENRLLIASCSQDNYIRLWKLESNLLEKQDGLEINLTDKKNRQEQQLREDEEDEDDVLYVKKTQDLDEELKLKSSLFTVESNKFENKLVQYSMNLESVLYGHEDWIYTVKFHPKVNNQQPLSLISASMDKTLVFWSYNEENAVWIDVARAGDLGGNLLGFYGATFDQTAQYIVAHGYQGALHLWKRNLEDKSKVYDSLNLNYKLLANN